MYQWWKLFQLALRQRPLRPLLRKRLVRHFLVLVLRLGVSFSFVALAASTAFDGPETPVFTHVLLAVAAVQPGAAEMPAICEAEVRALAS